jgi:hypothetical protein
VRFQSHVSCRCYSNYMSLVGAFSIVCLLKVHPQLHVSCMCALRCPITYPPPGLRTNTSNMQTMICTLGWIWTQLLTKSYCQMQHGRFTAAEWNSWDGQCYKCGKGMKAGSLGCHLADVHDIYQQTVVSKDLLEDLPPGTYTDSAGLHGRDLPCPFPGCEGQPRNGWMRQ